MKFQLLGLNHRSAPLEVRERLAISEARLGEALGRLVRHPGVREGLILSTCNRMEVVAHTSDGHADLRGFLREYLQVDPAIYEPSLYEYRAQDAVRHVFRVASSLDSMVVGEPQILGQVKEAYVAARALGAVNSNLDVLLTRAFTVAKRVRNETAVATSSVSVASVAVDLAKKIFGNLSGKVIYLVGAGKMTELAARHLVAHGAGTMFVSNRTFERAEKLAARFQGKALLFEQLYDTVDQADIVITSTGAPHTVFRRSHCELFLARRKNRPMFFIDIAVPRDVDPEVNKLDGIFLYDIDDLQTMVTSHVSDRSREAARAEEIVAEEVERFTVRVHTQQVVPAIVSLQSHLETIRQAEIDRVRGRLGTLSPEQEIAIDALTRGIVNKIMHTPIRALKTAAREQQATTVLDVFRRIFNLDNLNEPQAGTLSAAASAPGCAGASPRRKDTDFSLRQKISVQEQAPPKTKPQAEAPASTETPETAETDAAGKQVRS